jgi:hypothetical protein
MHAIREKIQDPDTVPSPHPANFLTRLLRPWFHYGTAGFRITVESILLVVALAFFFFYVVAPPLVVRYINHGLSGLPDYTGRVESVSIHPLACSIDIYDLHLDKDGVPVHFFYSPRWNVSLQWREIFHGVTRASVKIFDPQVNLVAGPSDNQSQTGISGVWIDAIKALIPWRINQLQIINGDAHFLDFHADPQVNLEMNKLYVYADNMSNAEKLKQPLPATIKITGCPLLTGWFVMNLSVNFDEKYATFTQDFQMDHVPAVGANSALQKYLKVRVKSGEIGLYSELTGDKGIYQGYAKPFFKDLEFEPKPSDEGGLGAVWSGVLNTVKNVFEDDTSTIATQTPISGRVDDPHVNAIAAITGALWNAYIATLAPGFNPKLSPPKPTDTVTTPKSEQTQTEAQQASPAEQKPLDEVKQKAANQK